MKTKIFSVILILFSFTVTAQNWKTINSNDTTYFTIDAPTGPDSLWHGFLRCVWVDSSNINGADSIFANLKARCEELKSNKNEIKSFITDYLSDFKEFSLAYSNLLKSIESNKDKIKILAEKSIVFF